jgi:hypothetical protein
MSVEGIEVDGVVTPLPQGATLERDGVHSSGEVERVMLPGEQLIANESGAYVGVRAVDGTQTRFRPGARYAKGRLIGFPENAAKGVPLPRGARVVVSGTFKDGDVVPIGGSVESENSGGLVAVGTTIFGLGYVPSVVVAAESNYKPDRWLYLPLAGPWINLTNRPTCTPPAGTPVGVDPCKPEQVARVAMVTLGVVQASALSRPSLGSLERPSTLVRTAP